MPLDESANESSARSHRAVPEILEELDLVFYGCNVIREDECNHVRDACEIDFAAGRASICVARRQWEIE